MELHIEAITVNLTRAYLKSCLESVHAVMDGEADGKSSVTLAVLWSLIKYFPRLQLTVYNFHRVIDPLESEEALLISLDMFANIARSKHTESGRLLVSEFKNLSIKYRELIQRATSLESAASAGSTDIKESLLVVELQLTWLVYLMSAIIGARVVRELIHLICTEH